MIKITLSILITVFLLATGCVEVYRVPPPRATELGPVPQNPTHTISVNLDSIPSGADVYSIEKDGQLGGKIGTTPFVYKVGIADQYRVYTDTRERISRDHCLVWGAGTSWEDDLTEDGAIRVGSKMLALNIALVKGDHSIAVASKELRRTSVEPEDRTIALTVPLKTLEQVNREVELYLRQQALVNARNNNVQSLNQNQNITIQQKKDGLDSVNSGLDALIKMSALGAFSR